MSAIRRTRSAPPRGPRTGGLPRRTLPQSATSDAVAVGIIGYGYWGPNLARNFNEAPTSTVVAVSDPRPERLAQAQGRYPAINVYTDFHELLADRRVVGPARAGRRPSAAAARTRVRIASAHAR